MNECQEPQKAQKNKGSRQSPGKQQTTNNRQRAAKVNRCLWRGVTKPRPKALLLQTLNGFSNFLPLFSSFFFWGSPAKCWQQIKRRQHAPKTWRHTNFYLSLTFEHDSKKSAGLSCVCKQYLLWSLWGFFLGFWPTTQLQKRKLIVGVIRSKHSHSHSSHVHLIPLPPRQWYHYNFIWPQ